MILTVLLLLAVVAVGGSVLYPVFPCPDCILRKANPKAIPGDLKNCGYCCGKGRATVFDHLKGKRDPALLQPAELILTPK